MRQEASKDSAPYTDRIECSGLRFSVSEAILTHARWVLLKKAANLSEKQVVKLGELLKSNLVSIKAYLMREEFQRFWEYKAPAWANKFLEDWAERTMRTQIGPMKKVAEMLRRHKELILNWFKAGGEISNGAVEGLNNKAKLTMRKAYGFKSVDNLKTALYHTMGDLPEPTTDSAREANRYGRG